VRIGRSALLRRNRLRNLARKYFRFRSGWDGVIRKDCTGSDSDTARGPPRRIAKLTPRIGRVPTYD
jgi:hypothetical protein